MATNTRACLAFAVWFAKQSVEFGIPPHDLAEMVKWAERSKATYEMDQTLEEDGCAKIVEDIAARHGVKVLWPGLWPTIEKNNYQTQLCSR